jgi:hypothetical protein
MNYAALLGVAGSICLAIPAIKSMNNQLNFSEFHKQWKSCKEKGRLLPKQEQLYTAAKELYTKKVLSLSFFDSLFVIIGTFLLGASFLMEVFTA